MFEPVEPIASDGIGDLVVQHMPVSAVTVEVLAIVDPGRDRRAPLRLGSRDVRSRQHPVGPHAHPVGLTPSPTFAAAGRPRS